MAENKFRTVQSRITEYKRMITVLNSKPFDNTLCEILWDAHGFCYDIDRHLPELWKQRPDGKTPGCYWFNHDEIKLRKKALKAAIALAKTKIKIPA